jgi:predicted dehydrogenase
MNACGRAIPSLGSEIRVFCERATIRTGIWGETLSIQRHGETEASTPPAVQSRTVWEQFLAVRDGREPNPSPPEVGLRMARLWDAIRASSAAGGAVVQVPVPEAARA